MVYKKKWKYKFKNEPPRAHWFKNKKFEYKLKNEH